MVERDDCELIDRTKVLAKASGLDPVQVKCPFIQTCDGTSCLMIDAQSVQLRPKRESTTAQVVFMSKLQKTIDIQNAV